MGIFNALGGHYIFHYQSINLFHDAKAQGEAVKDQIVTLVCRTQMQQLTIHEQKGVHEQKTIHEQKKNKIISSLHDGTTSIRFFRLQVNLIK